jgi:ubiquitin carboxyl-terminal hydrolase 5/13
LKGYKLAVKMGTITKDGKEDVYSYDEENMVEDKNIIENLENFGINIEKMEKSDK